MISKPIQPVHKSFCGAGPLRVALGVFAACLVAACDEQKNTPQVEQPVTENPPANPAKKVGDDKPAAPANAKAGEAGGDCPGGKWKYDYGDGFL
jgi:hypothetical protein